MGLRVAAVVAVCAVGSACSAGISAEAKREAPATDGARGQIAQIQLVDVYLLAPDSGKVSSGSDVKLYGWFYNLGSADVLNGVSSAVASGATEAGSASATPSASSIPAKSKPTAVSTSATPSLPTSVSPGASASPSASSSPIGSASAVISVPIPSQQPVSFATTDGPHLILTGVNSDLLAGQ